MIKDIGPGNVRTDAIVKEIGTQRSFTKFGREGVVVDITLKDDSGEIVLVLFEKPDLSLNQRIRVTGFAKEYKGALQLYLGKSGTIQNI